MSNKLRFMYGGMRHLVQHSRQLPKELLKQSRGIGVQWDSWWSREMFGLDVAMLSPKRMLPLLNVWQEEGWGEEGVTHFVWQIMALKFWIRCSWWQLINYGSVRFTFLRPKTHFQEASGEASAAQTTRWPGLWWDQRERLVSAFFDWRQTITKSIEKFLFTYSGPLKDASILLFPARSLFLSL